MGASIARCSHWQAVDLLSAAVLAELSWPDSVGEAADYVAPFVDPTVAKLLLPLQFGQRARLQVLWEVYLLLRGQRVRPHD